MYYLLPIDNLENDFSHTGPTMCRNLYTHFYTHGLAVTVFYVLNKWRIGDKNSFPSSVMAITVTGTPEPFGAGHLWNTIC